MTVAKRSRKPSEERPPDIEIGATVRADRMRFDRRPETDIEFVGRSVEEDESGSERINLPDEVEPGKRIWTATKARAKSERESERRSDPRSGRRSGPLPVPRRRDGRNGRRRGRGRGLQASARSGMNVQ